MSAIYHWLNGYETKRKRLLKKAPDGPLKDFLSVPFPEPTTPLTEVPILSVDFETTGLNAVTDKLLSVGFVEMCNNQIKLGTCYHQVIRLDEDLEASNVIIHHITDDIKSRGQELREVFDKFLLALAGKVMLVHFARIEKQFFIQACLELYGMVPAFPMIDTLVIAKRQLDKRDIAYDPSELRLASLRKKYHLPFHYAHNALNDAIATAELFLAQTHSMCQKEQVPLSKVLL